MHCHQMLLPGEVVVQRCAIYNVYYISIYLYTWLLTHKVGSQDKACIHTPMHVYTYTPLTKARGEEVHPTQHIRLVMQRGEGGGHTHKRVLRFTATSYLTKSLSLSAPHVIQGSHQTRENLFHGLSKLCHFSWIHYCSPFIAIPYNHSSLLHRHSSFIQCYFHTNIHPFCGHPLNLSNFQSTFLTKFFFFFSIWPNRFNILRIGVRYL